MLALPYRLFPLSARPGRISGLVLVPILHSLTVIFSSSPLTLYTRSLLSTPAGHGRIPGRRVQHGGGEPSECVSPMWRCRRCCILLSCHPLHFPLFSFCPPTPHRLSHHRMSPQDYGYGGYSDSPAKAYAMDNGEGVSNLPSCPAFVSAYNQSLARYGSRLCSTVPFTYFSHTHTPLLISLLPLILSQEGAMPMADATSMNNCKYTTRCLR